MIVIFRDVTETGNLFDQCLATALETTYLMVFAYYTEKLF